MFLARCDRRVDVYPRMSNLWFYKFTNIAVCGLAVVITQLLLLPNITAHSNERPNIIFILSDDQGWTDLGCLGSKYYESPNIDRLAAEGLTFTNYTVCQNCAPTRAALMSGLYAPRTGVYTVQSLARGDEANRKMLVPENITHLPLDKILVAETLQKAGYTTGMFGKWHLGHDQASYHPTQRGFDEAIVVGRGHFKYKTTPKVEVPEGQYLTDFLGDRAVDFIERHQHEPFFLYLPHNAVHTPIHAKEELIAKYEQKPKVGGHNDPAYAGMIESLDECVGRVMQKLDELKLADNTVLIFSSDNGGLGSYQVPGTHETKGITDNAPLREGKGSLYEGGVRVPLIVRWPLVITPGTRCNEPLVHVDMYPTFADLAQAQLPNNYTLDGVSMTQLFSDPQSSLHPRAIYAHFPGYLQSYIKEATWRTTPVATIRRGDWKLLEFFEDGRLELYNLAEDLSERHNLVETHPELTEDLHQQMLSWRKQTRALMPTHKK